MTSKRKYKPGRLIKNILRLEKIVNHGGWIFLDDKPVSPEFIKQMTFKTICGFLQYNKLRIAKKAE